MPPLKNIVRDLRDGFGSLSRRSFEWGRETPAPASSASVDFQSEASEEEGQSCWASLPPELLRDVVKRVEASESSWPARKHVVACASVCRSWRLLCKEIVGMPETSAKLTFPVSLKQPGPRTGPIQCYIKRNKATSSYHLYLGLNTDDGKFLLAARKIRRPTCAEYILSMNVQDVSRNSVSYMGKLRSNFLGTKFSIFDSQPPYFGAVTSVGRSNRRFYSRNKISPKVPSGSYGIAHVAYELNMLGTRGPRRMQCTMQSIPSSALQPDGIVPCYSDVPRSLENSFSTASAVQCFDHISGDIEGLDSSRFSGSTRFTQVSIDVIGKEGPLVLKNKTPRWHEQLQCWCLNFRGRVTVASVKNFQLIAATGEGAESTGAGNSHAGSSDHDKIILQFGKIGKDLFTMDYRYPLSAFQAFGICLTSFDTKLACE